MKKIYETASKPTQIILWDMFNERTCKIAADIEELHNIARELGIID